MAGGWEHTLAVSADGALFSWGGGYRDARRPSPPPVLGCGAAGGVGSVGSSGADAAAGTIAPLECVLVPRRVSALADVFVVGATCGWDHSLALSADGGLYSWGSGAHGKLGHGDEQDVWTPRRVEGFGSPAPGVGAPADGSAAAASTQVYFAVRAAAGCEHSVVVTACGALFTWGCGDRCAASAPLVTHSPVCLPLPSSASLNLLLPSVPLLVWLFPVRLALQLACCA